MDDATAEKNLCKNVSSSAEFHAHCGKDNEQTTSSLTSDSADGFTWTEEEEKAVRWKLDKVIVPLTTFLYMLCFLDRYVQNFTFTLVGCIFL